MTDAIFRCPRASWRARSRTPEQGAPVQLRTGPGHARLRDPVRVRQPQRAAPAAHVWTRARCSAIQSYWRQFAKAGDPNVKGQAEWPAYDTDADRHMTLAAEPAVGSMLAQRQLRLLGDAEQAGSLELREAAPPDGLKRPIGVLAPCAARPDNRGMARRIVLVCFDQAQPLDIVGPFEVFAGANAARLHAGADDPPYALSVVSPGGAAVRGRERPRAAGGRQPGAHRGGGLSKARHLARLRWAGARTAATDPTVQKAVRRAARRARRVASVCTGAFVLAASGLLDGKRATTHWASCARLARPYPRVQVETAPIYVRDGRVLDLRRGHGRDRPGAGAGGRRPRSRAGLAGRAPPGGVRAACGWAGAVQRAAAAADGRA